MQTEIVHWIVPEAINTSLQADTNENILDNLITLLEKTGQVLFHTIVKQDILHREALGSTRIAEGLSIPHAHTEGVRSFCAALGVVAHTSIYVLLAWNEHTPSYLKRLAAIIETLQKEDVKNAILAASSAQEVLEILEPQLQKYNIDL